MTDLNSLPPGVNPENNIIPGQPLINNNNLNTNNNNRTRNIQPQNTLFNVRDRLFHTLFFRAALSYAQMVPMPVRRVIEMVMLLTALCSMFILVYIHVTFSYTTSTCLEHVKHNWPRNGVVRVEILWADKAEAQKQVNGVTNLQWTTVANGIRLDPSQPDSYSSNLRRRKLKSNYSNLTISNTDGITKFPVTNKYKPQIEEIRISTTDRPNLKSNPFVGTINIESVNPNTMEYDETIEIDNNNDYYIDGYDEEYNDNGICSIHEGDTMIKDDEPNAIPNDNDDITVAESNAKQPDDKRASDTKPKSKSGKSKNSDAEYNPEDQYIVEYSLEYGFLRLSSAVRQSLNIPVFVVSLDPDKDSCFGDPFGRYVLKKFLGYDELLMASVGVLAEQEDDRGYLRNVITGEHYRFVSLWWISRGSYPAAFLIMILFTVSMAMLLRCSHHQIFVFMVDLLQMLEFNVPVRFPAAPLLTVILALVGMEAIMSEFFSNTATAFCVILIVWIADQYDAICCHTTITKRYWLRFFYLYHFSFYAYHCRFNGQYSNLALLTSWLFIQHSMIFFFHHYELPLIIQRAEFRQFMLQPRFRHSHQPQPRQDTTTNGINQNNGTNQQQQQHTNGATSQSGRDHLSDGHSSTVASDGASTNPSDGSAGNSSGGGRGGNGNSNSSSTVTNGSNNRPLDSNGHRNGSDSGGGNGDTDVNQMNGSYRIQSMTSAQQQQLNGMNDGGHNNWHYNYTMQNAYHQMEPMVQQQQQQQEQQQQPQQFTDVINTGAADLTNQNQNNRNNLLEVYLYVFSRRIFQFIQHIIYFIGNYLIGGFRNVLINYVFGAGLANNNNNNINRNVRIRVVNMRRIIGRNNAFEGYISWQNAIVTRNRQAADERTQSTINNPVEQHDAVINETTPSLSTVTIDGTSNSNISSSNDNDNNTVTIENQMDDSSTSVTNAVEYQPLDTRDESISIDSKKHDDDDDTNVKSITNFNQTETIKYNDIKNPIAIDAINSIEPMATTSTYSGSGDIVKSSSIQDKNRLIERCEKYYHIDDITIGKQQEMSPENFFTGTDDNQTIRLPKTEEIIDNIVGMKQNEIRLAVDNVADDTIKPIDSIEPNSNGSLVTAKIKPEILISTDDQRDRINDTGNDGGDEKFPKEVKHNTDDDGRQLNSSFGVINLSQLTSSSGAEITPVRS